MRSLVLTAFFIATALPANSLAASSEWLEAGGGRVRLVTSGPPNADGTLSGALEIDLEEGWKTYWRDPGGSGVPPTLDISGSTNIVSAELSFPAPDRFNDGGVKWAGYKHPVTFPVTFTLKAPTEPTKIQADVFLGICETICIPVQGQLTVDPANAPDDPEDAAIIKAALAALPSPERPDFGASKVRLEPERLVVEARVPDGAGHVDLFVAGDHGYMFGAPDPQEKNGKVFFTVPILDQPTTAPTELILHYTLVTDRGSVNGTLQFP